MTETIKHTFACEAVEACPQSAAWGHTKKSKPGSAAFQERIMLQILFKDTTEKKIFWLLLFKRTNAAIEVCLEKNNDRKSRHR